jgi:CHASE1-domain containing sensor protein
LLKGQAVAAFLGKQLFSRPPGLVGRRAAVAGHRRPVLLAASKTIEYDAGERFLHQAQNAQYNINSRINAYTDVLRGAASYFHAAEHVDRASFHRYVSGLDIERQFPALDNINYAQYVTAANRAAFERSLRASAGETALGYPDRAISPPEPAPSTGC